MTIPRPSPGLASARVELERLEELDRQRREATADADRQTAGMREVALMRAANAAAVMGHHSLGLARRLVAALEELEGTHS